MATEKSMELRARRTLARRGLRLVKNRRRDPLALDYATYSVIEVSTGALVFPLKKEGLKRLDGILEWMDAVNAKVGWKVKRGKAGKS